MQTIDKRQILQVLVGLVATLSFFIVIDYPLTSSMLIANFIILLVSPTQQMAKKNAQGQFLAQVVGISVGIMLGLLTTNVYVGVTIILGLVLTLPIWLKIQIPALPLAIAAYVIFEAESVSEASIERIILKVISITIALTVAWLFAKRYSPKKAKTQLYQQFLQLSQFIHELMWRTASERATISLPKSKEVLAVTVQSLQADERLFVNLNETLAELEMALRESKQEIPLIAQQELLYALRIHHDYLQQYNSGTLVEACFPYTMSESVLMSTWTASKPLALIAKYFQQLEQVAVVFRHD